MVFRHFNYQEKKLLVWSGEVGGGGGGSGTQVLTRRVSCSGVWGLGVGDRGRRGGWGSRGEGMVSIASELH